MLTRLAVLSMAASLVCIVARGTASAADYYVAPNGSDAGRGASAQPFRTIQKGIDSASKPGDAVIVLPGVYGEELKVRSNGSPAKPIVIRAAEKQRAVLDGADRVTGWRQTDAAHNVWSKEFGSKAPYNDGGGRWDMPPRSEQVFVGGKRCAHVKESTAIEAMPPYSFTATLSDPARYALTRISHRGD